TPSDGHKITQDRVTARIGGDFSTVSADQVQYIDISPKQMVGVSAGLIPFLEHDDANRALMGSNMQRQAVPLLVTEPPLVTTGLEIEVAKHSGMVVRSERDGYVVFCDAERILVAPEKLKEVPDGTSRLDAARALPLSQEYVMRKFVGLNERTCLNQKPIIHVGQK